MSKLALKGASTGTATFTIESPATNTDRTLTLPDAAGTVALTSQIPAAPTIASTAEAQAGTNNTNFITPLRMREGFNASGSAPVYACRAWVNFDGTGTVAIRASGNVSSVTRINNGRYTVNLSTAMPDANYSVATSGNRQDSTAYQGPNVWNLTTTSFSLATALNTNDTSDWRLVCAQVIR
jgi:hypothetical protein